MDTNIKPAPTLCFLDTETTSLDRLTRRAWDISIIRREPDGKETTHSWFIDSDDLDLASANLMSLKIGGFYERHPNHAGNDPYAVGSEMNAAMEIAFITRDAVLVGAVPSFDEETLDRMLRRCGLLPAWNYHLIDVETLAAGALRLPPRWDFDTLLNAYGLTYDEADRHTALGDARMARDLYDAVMSGQVKPN